MFGRVFWGGEELPRVFLYLGSDLVSSFFGSIEVWIFFSKFRFMVIEILRVDFFLIFFSKFGIMVTEMLAIICHLCYSWCRTHVSRLDTSKGIKSITDTLRYNWKLHVTLNTPVRWEWWQRERHKGVQSTLYEIDLPFKE